MLPLYALGGVDWLTTQTLYHGIAEMGEEAIVLCWPMTPYVSLGCHQDGDEFDASCGLPGLRRRVGGTLVYLDANQVFFQVILNAKRLPSKSRPIDWYHLALDPVVAYLGDRGLVGTLRPPADILVGDRKISGNAGGQIGDQMVVVGNLLLSFPHDVMVRVRNAPNQMLREAFAASLHTHMLALREIPGHGEWTTDSVMQGLAHHYKESLGARECLAPWDRWSNVLDRVATELQDPEWLAAPGMRLPYHQIKIREGVYLRSLRVGASDPRSSLVVEFHVDDGSIHSVWGADGIGPGILPLGARALSDINLPVQLRTALEELTDLGRPIPWAPSVLA